MKSSKEKIPPDLPEINKPVISRSKRLLSDDISPDLSKIFRDPETKKIPKDNESLGTCYKEIDCKIPFLENVTMKQCKDAGGKSWKEKECKNL